MQTGVGCLVQGTPELQLHWDRLGRIQVGYILPVRGATRGWRSGNHMDTTRRFARLLQSRRRWDLSDMCFRFRRRRIRLWRWDSLRGS